MGNCVGSHSAAADVVVTGTTAGAGGGGKETKKSHHQNHRQQHHLLHNNHHQQHQHSHRSSVISTTSHELLHQGLLRDRSMDVYEKYIELEVLGEGSMGHVARVQVREGFEGGSAFRPQQSTQPPPKRLSRVQKRKSKEPEVNHSQPSEGALLVGGVEPPPLMTSTSSASFTPTTARLFDRRKEKVEYALKSIKLDRVSPIFKKELDNEIDVLKGMVRERRKKKSFG